MVATKLFLLIVMIGFATNARASTPNEAALTPAMLLELEHRADAAATRDQCALYTELAHGLTELAGRQIDAGDEDSARLTVEWVDRSVNKIHVAARRDAKHLQDAEMLLEHTTHRLNDMMRIVSTEQRVLLKNTLAHLNGVHTEILMQVFAR